MRILCIDEDKIRRTIPVCVTFALLLSAGCASSPNISPNKAIASGFGDDNLDVLFATEFPVATKEEALAKAALAFRDAEYDKAQFYLVRALKFDVTDCTVLAQIGNLHVVQGNTKLAARAYNYALQQDAQHAGALEGLGLLHFRSGNDKEAEILLHSALSTSADLWRAHNALGVIADRNRDFATALTHYNSALALRPESDSVLINRGYSLFLDKQYRDASLNFYEAATRSGNLKAWRNLAMVYAHQGWYADALQTYLEALDPADAHNEVGAIASRNGDFDEAWHYLNEAIRLSPTFFASAEENISRLAQRQTASRLD